MSKLDDRAVALFKGKNFAYIATIGSDGSPQVTPVWADTDGTNIWVNTAIGRIKHKNASRDKRVTVAIHEQGNPYSWVSVKGKVTKQITGKEADDHIDFLSEKYTGNKKYQNRKPSEQRVILVIEPISVIP
jgi:PPOX class probable F420-dependent enzyme